MTLGRLIKQLQKIEKQLGPRATIVIDSEVTSSSHTPDYFTHVGLNKVESETIVWYVDGSGVLANGEERLRTVVVLK